MGNQPTYVKRTDTGEYVSVMEVLSDFWSNIETADAGRVGNAVNFIQQLLPGVNNLTMEEAALLKCTMEAVTKRAKALGM